MHILIVDDDPVTLDILSNMMSKMGIKPCQAMNGQEGLLHLERDSSIRLIFVDLQMPKMDGQEFISEVRKKYGRFHHYIVIISATKEDDSISRAAELGADLYITKPIHPEVVELTMRYFEEPKTRG